MTENGVTPPTPPQIRLNLGAQNGKLMLASIDLENIPGGWETTHMMLLSALNMCLEEIKKTYRGEQPLIQVPSMQPPKGLS